MPRWTIELSEGTLTADEKRTIAEKVNGIYTSVGHPHFFPNVHIHESKREDFFVGLKSTNHVFFIIDHTAATFESEEQRLRFLDQIDSIVRPIFEPKDIHWEFNIYEHPKHNWRIDGIIPPVEKPEVMEQWVKQNKAFPY